MERLPDPIPDPDETQSKELKASDRHFTLCEIKIENIICEIKKLNNMGQLDLVVDDPKDIDRGVNTYFCDLAIRYQSNEQRLRILKRVFDNIGNDNSRVWKDLLNLIKDFQNELLVLSTLL